MLCLALVAQVRVLPGSIAVRKVLFIFGQLTDRDVEWLARIGRRQQLDSDATLIHEGVPVDTLYFVLSGELSVVRGSPQREIARLSAGELVGEMSFIDARPPSATVLGRAGTVLCAIPRREVEHHLVADVAFAARFYKAVATFLSDRVRRMSAEQYDLSAEDIDELDDVVIENVDRAGARFDLLSKLLLDSRSL
jgi:CRP-like cAMP-binding protein